MKCPTCNRDMSLIFPSLVVIDGKREEVVKVSNLPHGKHTYYQAHKAKGVEPVVCVDVIKDKEDK